MCTEDRTLYTPYLPPRTDETPAMHMLRLYNTADLEACPLDKWGILDPGETRRDAGHEGEKRQDGEPLPGHASGVLSRLYQYWTAMPLRSTSFSFPESLSTRTATE